MSKSGFFQKGAFYGGTALRIFYGLHHFSEDMDFSLMYPDPSFALSDYLPAVEEELSAVGLKMHVEQKNKTKVTDIQSAFIKGGTLIQFISIQQTDEILIPGIHKQEQSERWDASKRLTLQDAKELLKDRFSQLDFEAAKKDVIPFLADTSELELWNPAFFQAITENLTASTPMEQKRTR
ncbi:nucleotidyl transferase AbiEii/AbiGii toxin family protein [Mitsuokella jalaludinii]|uniref:nucleotidyl transferase AbiEii/AbiGii toxin family protein n=1 Tax=Mitsuokella jalaludinii TaxID=187979 RepID=UPI00307A00E4